MQYAYTLTLSIFILASLKQDLMKAAVTVPLVGLYVINSFQYYSAFS